MTLARLADRKILGATMTSHGIEVAYQAEPQYERLSQLEQAALAGIGSPDRLVAKVEDDPERERFSSSLGEDKRVLWTRAKDGKNRVLLIAVKLT
jgi:hypothetical protein